MANFSRLLALYLFFGVAACSRLYAHAILVRSTPAEHAVVHGSTLHADLEYNSRIDAARSTLTLTDARGRKIALRMEPAAQPYQLKAIARNLASGAYLLHWQVLASDGHITRGDVAFTVVAN